MSFPPHFRVSDAGNISAPTLESGHSQLQHRVFGLLQSGKLPVVLGGGDDQSFCNAMGFLRHQDACGTGVGRPVVINIDAHLDCRTLDDRGKVHSG